LPVLVGLGRAHDQVLALRSISEDYRTRTVLTLRTAFLSSLALELIATLSVAIVAVFIGVRLVYGQMPLEFGLLALLLAPECFTPFRAVGTAFHAAEDGREALDRARAVIDEPVGDRFGADAGSRTGGPLRVNSLSVRYPSRSTDAVSDLGFVAPEGEITVLDGPSGSGKSTVFGVLTGRVRNSEDGTRITGHITGLDAQSVAWLPQHPHAVADTLEEELLVYGGDVPGAVDYASATLDQLGLGAIAKADPHRLSPGELRRLAFGRVMMRVNAGARLVLLDEPTAHLDGASANILIAAISRLRGQVTIIVASHDESVRALADHRVLLADEVTPGADTTVMPSAQPATPRQRAAEPQARQERPLREFLRFVRPIRGQLMVSLLLGTLAALFAIALTALSAWLIVRASQQPAIMYLLVAIVGVRFFGLGRAVLRYVERLSSHNAVFAALTGLRMRLWSGLAAGGAADRGLLRPGNTLAALVRDVDQVRDLSIRVVLPLLSGVLTTVVAIAGLSIIHPPMFGLFASMGILVMVVAPILALRADRAAATAEQSLRSAVVRRLAALLTAADDLRANGVERPLLRRLRSLDADAGSKGRRGAWAVGLGNALVVLVCCSTALLVLPAGNAAVQAGALQPELIAVLALTWLGLIDPLLDLVSAVQQLPALRAVLGSVSTLSNRGQGATGGATPPEVIDGLALEHVSAAWPGSGAAVFDGLTARTQRGEWLVVTGPSGSGKSTLLAVLLGQLRPTSGRYLVNDTDTAELDPRLLRSHFAWCPQEGHLFASTLRANLLVARERDDIPTDAELDRVVREVGLGPLVDKLPAGLATPIGSEGSFLSGGERQRLAVARTLLTRSDVILIDEPTAHLDEQSAAAVLSDLRIGLRDRTTVLVTHQAIGIRPGDKLVELGVGNRTQEHVGAAA
jgi:ATP-binding cassette subfamily C protein CydCD